MFAVRRSGQILRSYGSVGGLRNITLRAAVRMFPNSKKVNRVYWNRYDWSKAGEEWSNEEFPQWKDSFVEGVLTPFIGEGHSVLEIGPGAGRWSEHIIPKAGHAALVDISESCIEICKGKFGDRGSVEYHVNSGADLSFIESNSVDRVWSFDVFVHIEPEDVAAYVPEIARVMKPGARGLIHHARAGKRRFAWRSDMTAERMQDFCRSTGLTVVDQFDSWGEDWRRLWPALPREGNPDIITVFEKPADAI